MIVPSSVFDNTFARASFVISAVISAASDLTAFASKFFVFPAFGSFVFPADGPSFVITLAPINRSEPKMRIFYISK